MFFFLFYTLISLDVPCSVFYFAVSKSFSFIQAIYLKATLRFRKNVWLTPEFKFLFFHGSFSCSRSVQKFLVLSALCATNINKLLWQTSYPSSQNYFSRNEWFSDRISKSSLKMKKLIQRAQERTVFFQDNHCKDAIENWVIFNQTFKTLNFKQANYI